MLHSIQCKDDWLLKQLWKQIYPVKGGRTDNRNPWRKAEVGSRGEHIEHIAHWAHWFDDWVTGGHIEGAAWEERKSGKFHSVLIFLVFINTIYSRYKILFSHVRQRKNLSRQRSMKRWGSNIGSVFKEISTSNINNVLSQFLTAKECKINEVWTWTEMQI